MFAGGTVFADELDIKLKRATVDMLGSTGSISITKEDTVILNGCEQIRSLVAEPLRTLIGASSKKSSVEV